MSPLLPGHSNSLILSRVRSRLDWKAQYPTGAMRPHTVERITVHHTATQMTAAPDAQLRAIQGFHQGPERGWPDIAYHYFVDANGVTWAARDTAFEGDSATDYDLAGHLHIAVLGNFEHEPPPAAQLDGLRAAIAQLGSDFRLPRRAVASHRDFADTACPGAALYQLIGSESR
jgi:hypothetical protein